MLENGVVVLKEFTHAFKRGSKLYVSSSNEIVLEFFEQQDIVVYRILNDGTTWRHGQLKKPAGLDSPVYFSDDFLRVLQFDFDDPAQQSNKGKRRGEVEKEYVTERKMRFRLLESKPSPVVGVGGGAGSKQFEQYKVLQTDLLLPEYEQVAKNEKNLPYIALRNEDQLTYLNVHNIE